MPWIVGIDEAGYGPNLGPFVMTSVACWLPEAPPALDLWQTLRPAVRRHHEPDDGRLLVEDSKLVYTPARGLRDLEANVLAALSGWRSDGFGTVSTYVACVSPPAEADLRREPWYAGTTALPVAAVPGEYHPAAERFRQTCL